QRAASAVVPVSLILSTIKAAIRATAEGAMAAFPADNVAALSKGVTDTMRRTRLVPAVLLTVVALVAGAGLLAYPGGEGKSSKPASLPADVDKERPPEASAALRFRRDQDGEPLPAEAIARLGTT